MIVLDSGRSGGGTREEHLDDLRDGEEYEWPARCAAPMPWVVGIAVYVSALAGGVALAAAGEVAAGVALALLPPALGLALLGYSLVYYAGPWSH